MSIYKEEFLELYHEHITREGADALLNFLENQSDFFTAPASAKQHAAFPGGLCSHSINVFHSLLDYLSRDRVQDLYGLECSMESLAIVSLLHDVCKVGCFSTVPRSKKDENGQTVTVSTYRFNDPLPYGHGEKSVYIINGYLRLTRVEAMAIRWHMGFSSSEPAPMVEDAFQKFPLAFALATANKEASYFLDQGEG